MKKKNEKNGCVLFIGEKTNALLLRVLTIDIEKLKKKRAVYFVHVMIITGHSAAQHHTWTF